MSPLKFYTALPGVKNLLLDSCCIHTNLLVFPTHAPNRNSMVPTHATHALTAQYLDNACSLWLERLIDHLPERVRDHSWCPHTPPHLQKASELLRRMHKLQQARVLRARLTPPLLAQLSQKVVASEVWSICITMQAPCIPLFFFTWSHVLISSCRYL